MSAPFNDILHGDLDRLELILDREPMDEQELRAALQNVVREIVGLQRKVRNLEKKVGNHMSLCEKCTPRELKAMRALESLTPSGSEFVNDPERCVAFVRDRLSTNIKLAKQRKDLRTALQNIGNVVGAPTMDYADPEFQRKQSEKRVQEISQIIQEALL